MGQNEIFVSETRMIWARFTRRSANHSVFRNEYFGIQIQVQWVSPASYFTEFCTIEFYPIEFVAYGTSGLASERLDYQMLAADAILLAEDAQDNIEDMAAFSKTTLIPIFRDPNSDFFETQKLMPTMPPL